MRGIFENKKLLFSMGGAILVLVGVGLFLLVGNGSEVKVTFKANNGESDQVVEVKKGETVTPPEEPSKENADFGGWYLKDKLFDFSTKINSNTVLEAKWVEEGNKIVLNVLSLTLLAGEEKDIDVVSLPEEIKKEDIVWTSSDEKIVIVSETGVVKGVAAGSATVTVKTKDEKYSTNIGIKVAGSKEEKEELETAVTGVTVSASSKIVTVGGTVKLTANIKPTNAKNKNVTWKSSNEKVAKVDKNGTVTAVGKGKATITVTTEDGKKTSSVDITVTKKEETPKKDTSNNNSNSNSNSNSSSNSNNNNNNNTADKDDDNKGEGNTQPSGGTQTTGGEQNDDPTPTPTPDPTPETPKEETHVYTISFTVANQLLDNPTDYNVTLKKDGTIFTDYDLILYGNTVIKSRSPKISAKNYDVNIKTADVYLNDGTNVTAKITY